MKKIYTASQNRSFSGALANGKLMLNCPRDYFGKN